MTGGEKRATPRDEEAPAVTRVPGTPPTARPARPAGARALRWERRIVNDTQVNAGEIS
ncbi:hypothetical protein Mame01_41290 [Microbispora amethystogenes]|nr:hypothetical protein Mame01_41290 [Microbispora amethystogenes]